MNANPQFFPRQDILTKFEHPSFPDTAPDLFLIQILFLPFSVYQNSRNLYENSSCKNLPTKFSLLLHVFFH